MECDISDTNVISNPIPILICDLGIKASILQRIMLLNPFCVFLNAGVQDYHHPIVGISFHR